ncbi:MAG: M48 family metalloprotease [Candidatus Nanopelagicales bacterium]
MTDSAPIPTSAASPVRPDVLRLWSPAAVQFAVLIAAVLTAGLFAGNWLHNTTSVGAVWQDRMIECWGGGPSGSTAAEQLQHQQAFEACTAAAERQRAAYSFGGMIVAAVAAGVVLVMVPMVIGSRRGLRPLPPQLAPTAQRAAELTDRMGVRRTPELLIGTTKLRDAFSYGLPHRYRVVLPPKLAVSFGRPAVLDPVLAHEVAHVARHDVTYAWLARTVWYSIVPVLAVPFLISAVQRDLTLAGDFLWRAVLLLGVVRLITARLLRAREYEADLTAARYLGVEPVVLGLSAVAPAPDRRGLSAALALHPTPAQRRAVLEDEARLATPRFVDGLTAGFLTGAAAPLLLAAFMTLLTGSGVLDLAHVATAVLAGGALGVVVGLVSWRTVLVDRLSPARAQLWRLAVGVGVGLVLGEYVSLGQTGTQGVAEPAIPWWLLVPLVLGAGATASVGGLAELWADGAPRRTGPPRVAPALVGAAVAGSGLALMLAVRPVLAQGLVADVAVLATTRLGLLVAVVMLVVATCAAVWTRAGSAPGGTAPDWLLARGTAMWPTSASASLAATTGYGLLAGLTGGAAIIGYRAVVGAAPGDLVETRFLYYLVLGALVAAVAMLVLSVGLPGVGPGAGLVAAVTAALTVSTVVLLLNAALGGSLDMPIIGRSVQGALGLGVLLSLLAGAVGLLPHGRTAAPRVLALTTIALSIVASLAVLRAAPVASAESEARAYLQGTASALEADGATLVATFTAITADPTSTGEQSAERIRVEVLPLVRSMQSGAASEQPQDPKLRAAHALVVESLATAERGFVTMAEALDAYDPVQYAAGSALWTAANQTWAQWRMAVAEAAAAAGAR